MPEYAFGSFRLDSEARTLSRDGEPVPLTSKAFETLLLLLQNKGRLVRKDEFFSRVWQSTIVEEANLTQTIFCVRRVLGDRPKDHRYIATVPGSGYQFVGEVVEIAIGRASLVQDACRPEIGSGQISKRPRWPFLIRAAMVPAAVLLGAALSVFWHHQSARIPRLTGEVQLTNDGESKNELVTDGVRVFYASPTHASLSSWRTRQVSMQGGERDSPRVDGEMSPLDISPDHRTLLLARSEVRQSEEGWRKPAQLWFQPLGGGPPTMSTVRAHDASWSPDGRQIAYAFEKQIALARVDGTARRRLADLPGVPSGLRWSPNGGTIRFTLHSGIALKDSGIWEVPVSGGQAHPLFPDLKSQHADGQWTADGTYYLFSRMDNGVSQIWALPERRQWLSQGVPNPVQLTTGPIHSFLPTPSPDGKRVLFLGMLQRVSLLKYEPDRQRFEPFLPGISGAHLDFSRDGKWLTYSSFPDHALWRAAADGTHRLQVSPPGMIAMLPVMSPDGTRIAFAGASPGQPTSVFVVSRDGGRLQRVLAAESNGLAEPAWSPDGTALILGAFDYNTPLHQLDLATGKLLPLPHSEGLWSPRWSPDGRFVAALKTQAARLTLYDLHSFRQWTLTETYSFNPVWSHDGQTLYFGSGEQDSAWFRIGIQDRQIERVASLSGSGVLPAKPSRGIPTWNYWWTGLGPGDSLLAAREAGSTEIYSSEWIGPK